MERKPCFPVRRGTQSLSRYSELGRDSALAHRNFKGRNYAHFAQDEESLRRYRPFRAVGRHAKLYLYTEEALYETPE